MSERGLTFLTGFGAGFLGSTCTKHYLSLQKKGAGVMANIHFSGAQIVYWYF